MHYHDPITLCRQVFLDLSTGRPRALFRRNRTNAKARWGKPVPTLRDDSGPILIYDHGVAPICYYGRTLLAASEEHPIDCPVGRINHTPDPGDAETIDHLRRTAHQSTLRDLRDTVCQQLVHRLLPKIGSDPAYRYVEDVLQEVSTRLGLGVEAVTRTMQRLENFTFIPRPTRVAAYKRDATMPWFSRGDWRFGEVQKALAVLRVSRLNKTSFSIDDLAVHNGVNADGTETKGGYPSTCPVTGLEFEWGINAGGQTGVSLYSPKVGRYDISQPYGPGNVVLMSAWARRLVEGFGSPATLAPLLKSRPELLRRIKDWDDRHPIPHLHTFLHKIDTINDTPQTAMRRHTRTNNTPMPNNE